MTLRSILDALRAVPRPPGPISPGSRSEGKKNQTTLFTFTVTLSATHDQPVTMSFRTVNGTATTSDNDYVGKTGTITFAPGETTKTIAVTGDHKKETDEDFYLDLFDNSGNSLITKPASARSGTTIDSTSASHAANP